jgi:ABC-2 type transport system permease protein
MTRTRSAALLRHELRLLVRAWGIDRWARGFGGPRLLVLAVLLVLHLLYWPVVLLLPEQAPATPTGRLTVAAVALSVLALILGSALSQWVAALFLRRDLDLLLSAPVPPGQVLAARTLAVALFVLAPVALLLWPLATLGLLTGRHWLAGLYLSVPIAALLACTVGLLLALALVLLLGPRRARTAIQVMGIGAGAVLYLVTQLGIGWLERWLAVDDLTGAARVLVDASNALALAAPTALAMAGALTTALLWLAWRRLGHLLLQLHAASGARRAAAQDAPARPFKTRPVLAIMRKEWRCTVRDTVALSQLAFSLVIVVPGLILGLTHDNTGSAGPGLLVFFPVAFAGLLAQQLAQLMINAEEAPVLAYHGALPLRDVLTAKLLAAVLPASAIGVALMALLMLDHPLHALLAAPFVVLAAFVAAALLAANVRIVPRNDFGTGRGQPPLDVSLIGTVLVFAQGGAAAAAMVGWWLPALAVAALATVFPAHEFLQMRRHLQPWQIDRPTS